MDWDEFRDWSHRAADWGADYRSTLRERPVRAQTAPGEIAARIAASPPEAAEPMAAIFADFERTIVPGHDALAASALLRLFPGQRRACVGRRRISRLGDRRAVHALADLAGRDRARDEDDRLAAPGARPARRIFRRHPGFGIVRDACRPCSPCASARSTGPATARGLAGQKALRVYCSDQVHTSIDRAIWVAGIGEENLVRLPGRGPLRGMDASALDAAIARDRAAGFLPVGHHRHAWAAPASAAPTTSLRSPLSPVAMASICTSMLPGLARR